MSFDPAAIAKRMMQGYAFNTRPLEDCIHVTGKVAMITGGTSGLGFCVAKRLLEGGASIVVSSHSEKEAETAISLFSQLGFGEDRVRFCKCNVCSEEEVEALVKFTAESFGSLDIVVTCAGVWSFAHLYDLPESEFNRVLDVNLGGTFRTAKFASRYMVEKGIQGKMVFVSSDVYLMPFPLYGGYPHYAASKGGIVAMTTEIARELRPFGILVNTVAPGPMGTPGGMFNGVLPSLPQEKKDQLAAERAVIKLDTNPDTDAVALSVYMMCTSLADNITGDCILSNMGMAHGIKLRQPATQEYPPKAE